MVTGCMQTLISNVFVPSILYFRDKYPCHSNLRAALHHSKRTFPHCFSSPTSLDSDPTSTFRIPSPFRGLRRRHTTLSFFCQSRPYMSTRRIRHNLANGRKVCPVDHLSVISSSGMRLVTGDKNRYGMLTRSIERYSTPSMSNIRLQFFRRESSFPWWESRLRLLNILDM